MREKHIGPGFLAATILLATAISPARGQTVRFDQSSDPLLAAFPATNALLPVGTKTTTVAAPIQIDDAFTYRFVIWDFDGATQRDFLDRSRNPAPVTILAPVAATATYYKDSLDANSNSIPDWWEDQYHTSPVLNVGADADADGFTVLEEHHRDQHPRIADRFTGGGLSLVTSDIVPAEVDPPFPSLASNQVAVLYLGQPRGFLNSLTGLRENTWLVTNLGAVLTGPNLRGEHGDYTFGYWSLNGVRQADPQGRSLGSFRTALATSTVVEAVFALTDDDLDADTIPDWYELLFFGTTGTVSDIDADGFDFANEYRRDQHPTIADRFTGGGVSLAQAGFVEVIVDTNLARVSIGSDPATFVPTDTYVTNKGSIISLPDEYGVQSGYRFTHWEINGNRLEDLTGRSHGALNLVLTGNVSIVARYLQEFEDEDADGIRDWYEIHFGGTTNLSPTANSDGDAFQLLEEFERDLHPYLSDRSSPGGVSLGFAPVADYYPGTNAPGLDRTRFFTYTLRSVPTLLLPFDNVITAAEGTQVDVPSPVGLHQDYRFVHWELDSVPQRDANGRGVATFSFVLSTNADVRAIFVGTDTDGDSDGIPDWYELHYAGSTNAVADADGDGFGLDAEYHRGYHAGQFDRADAGGVSLGFAPQVLVNVQFFSRPGEVLVSGVPTRFFSTDASTSGVFAATANSHPALGDWDGDGDLDLFVGGSNGVMRVFENAGSPLVLNLVERTSNFAAIAFAWTNIVNPAPALGDWSGDGWDDLAVGGETGGVWLVQSPGSFREDALTVAPQTTRSAPVRASPTFGDVNGDDRVDLLLLTDAGLVQAYTNTHAPTLPFSHTPALPDLLGAPVPNARGIATADVNNDGLLDILVSDENGNIWEFHGVASP